MKNMNEGGGKATMYEPEAGKLKSDATIMSGTGPDGHHDGEEKGRAHTMVDSHGSSTMGGPDGCGSGHWSKK